MYRIDTPGSVNGHWAPPNPKTGAKGTLIGYDWLEEIQEEIVAVVQAGGLTLSKGTKTQLRDAIAAMIVAGGGGGGGGGAISFGANVNTAGFGVFDAVAGNTLQFRGVAGHTDGTVSITYDAATKSIRVQAVSATGVQRGTIQLAGHLGGTAAAPDVRGMRETGGPTNLTYGAVPDGTYLRRSGSTVVGDSSTVPDADAVTKGKVQLAGHLGGSAAAPDVRGMRETGGPTLLTYGVIADGGFFRRVGSTVVGDSAPVPDADAVTKGKVQLAGQLGGSAAAPDVRGVRETGGPTLLTFGAIADGHVLVRSGSSVVGLPGGGAGNVVGPGAGPVAGELSQFNGTTNTIEGSGIVAVNGQIPASAVRPTAWDFHTAQVLAWGAGLAFVGMPNPLSLNGQSWQEIRDADGRWARAISPATSGLAAGALTPSYDWWEPRWDLDHTWVLRPQSLSDVRLWVGLFDLNPKASATHATQQIAGFRFDTGAGDTVFVCYSAGGAGTAESTVTAVAPATGVRVRLRVQLSYTPTPTVRFWINDTLVATHTTRVPVGSAPIGGGVSLTALTAVGKTIDISRADLRSK